MWDFLARSLDASTIFTFAALGELIGHLVTALEGRRSLDVQVELDALKPFMQRIDEDIRQLFPQFLHQLRAMTFGPPSRARIEARFRGPDPQVLRELGEQAATIARRHPLLDEPDAIGRRLYEVAELAALLDVELTADMGELLWCALYTDTGGFRYSSTDARALRLAGRHPRPRARRPTRA